MTELKTNSKESGFEYELLQVPQSTCFDSTHFSYIRRDLYDDKHLYVNRSKAILSIKAQCRCLNSTLFSSLLVYKIAVS